MKSIAAVARVKVSADGRGVVSHAGTGMLRELAELNGLSARVTAVLADTYRGPWTYAPGALFADLAAAVAAEADCIDGVGQRCAARLPPPDWDLPLTVLQRLEDGEANVAARVGYSVAIGEHLAAAGPGARLAELGHATRAALADVAGWRVVEPVGEPTAITTLTPLDGADPQKVRSWLIAERGIVTTYAEALAEATELLS